MTPATVGTGHQPPAAAIPDVREIDPAFCRDLKVFFTDIDDTLTDGGLLPAASLAALYRLSAAGVAVVPVTGRPAGWCDHIARMWPVKAVVGENGAFYYAYDRDGRSMRRVFLQTEAERRAAAEKLRDLASRVMEKFPWVTVAADQPFRLSDVAFDLCEDRAAPTPDEVRALCAFLDTHRPGPKYKISSIHLNVWWGTYDKKTCLFRLLDDLGNGVAPEECFYIGDSPNDEPLFEALPVTAAVANIRCFLPGLAHPPAYIAREASAAGFCETVDVILSRR